jgi:hypothetical protein
VARGDINTTNLLTLISVAVLVGTEIFGVALAAGWAIAGLFELGQTVGYVLMAVFGVIGAYALFRFMQRAATVEPLRQ